jgi:adenylate cyclase class IV
MARNIEIKASAPDVADMMRKAASLAAAEPVTIEQTDVFFKTDRGRLKLRLLSPTHGELIFYERSDQPGPKISDYSIYATENPLGLRAVLSATYGEDITVAKVRTLFLVGRTRIHLDEVRHLDQFVELEVVLDDGQPAEAGIAEASWISSAFARRPDRRGICGSAAAQTGTSLDNRMRRGLSRVRIVRMPAIDGPPSNKGNNSDRKHAPHPLRGASLTAVSGVLTKNRE